ncbi:hypothetical protein DICPUDRAFT_83534 [Dictyostelium purpureum]|uniref:Uncharacterized protein n=1 Tax=Dictyostelium purpureum TaxID=5786 RepID=F0ZZT6_DICPU|nr:uncharacterized protein DICPUDRAFT_83534 [Dictyostelium purpureum]EGC30535.1 hypothetical protein DICPUDRAFT_83534 [Dictyostelium purpureum]|eukprot:XP_003292930.1 hypothetical protein DICPUDRAFT_83534 [Dictyostelium purpureum]
MFLYKMFSECINVERLLVVIGHRFKKELKFIIYQEIEEFDVVIVASLDRLTRRSSDFSDAVQLFTKNHISLFIIMAPIDLFGDGISLLVDFDKSSCYTTTVKMWANAFWTQVAIPFDQVIEQLKTLFSGFIQLSIYVGRYYEQIKSIEIKFGEKFIDSFRNDKVLTGFYFSRTFPGKFNQTSSSINNSNKNQIIFLKGLIFLSESSKNPQVPAHSYKSIDKPTYQKNNDEYNIEIEDENEKDDFFIVSPGKFNQTFSSISTSNENQIIFLKSLISLSESSKNPQVSAHSYKSIDKPTYQKNNDEYNIEIEDENEKDGFFIVNKINQFSETIRENEKLCF